MNNKEKKDTLYMLVEIPRCSKEKFEYSKLFKKMVLDRFVPLNYPGNYGQIYSRGEEILNTLEEDGDPLDVLCLGNKIASDILVPIRIVGVLKMTDGGKQDNKLIAVAEKDETFNKVKDVKDLEEILVKRIEFFFNEYKKPRGIIQIEGWGTKEEAEIILKNAEDNYKKNNS